MATKEDVKAIINRVCSLPGIVSHEVDLAYLCEKNQVEIHTIRSCAENRMKEVIEELLKRFSPVPGEFNQYAISLLHSTQRKLMMDEMRVFNILASRLPFIKEFSFGVAIDDELGNYIEIILIATKWHMKNAADL